MAYTNGADQPPIEIVFIDLDGTLANSSGEFTARTRTALKQAQAAGLKVVLATGRPAHVVQRVCRDLDLGGPYIALNGGACGDMGTGEVELAGEFHQEAAQTLCRFVQGFDALLAIHDATGWFADQEDERTRRRIAFLQQEPRQIGYEPGQLEKAIKIMAIGEDEALRAIAADLPVSVQPHIDCFRTTESYLEFVPKGLNKAQAAQKLLDAHGLTWGQAAAFGDGDNDRALLESVGHSFAMANARPEVKGSARFHAPSNDEDGVAVMLEKMVAGEVAF
ncbi:Cof-type HAD-IIB family hydrolase [Pseudovibrio exalbescens]|nr:Cof-type HAD-IIB family hydrolase [Pseudovibrio exalbescens]